MDSKTADRLLKDDIIPVRTKKCGHQIGYKCSCRGGENADRVFDCVDEMALRKHRPYKYL
jgi:hypothetical protein